jgi:PIN domain nuclease of toxin-antitoxin system
VARTRQVNRVLDASVALATVLGGPGGDLSDDHYRRSVVSLVNVCEVEATLLDHGVPESEFATMWENLGVRTVALNHPMSNLAAMLIHRFRSVGLSLGDAACIATAAHMSLPTYAADRRWADLDGIGTEVHLIR